MEKVQIQNLSARYGERRVLDGVTLPILEQEILSIIGPANSGKTTFLRSLNRLAELEPSFRLEGRILLNGTDIYGPAIDIAALRRKLGMVYAVPVPLPRSIFENLVFGPRLAGTRDRARLEELVERSLRAAFLWDEVKDRLQESALKLSGGQQQRLCVARVLALEPEVLLLDEPCSGLDPISTRKIEEALQDLKSRYSVVIVTNNTKQAARASDRTAFFLSGQMIECAPTPELFASARDQRTEDYITGRYG